MVTEVEEVWIAGVEVLVSCLDEMKEFRVDVVVGCRGVRRMRDGGSETINDTRYIIVAMPA